MSALAMMVAVVKDSGDSAVAGALVLLEFNEVNMDFVSRYVAAGHLPVMGRAIRLHGVVETTSEDQYEHLEPWIQWVTAHTGLTYAQHRISRLGDIVQSNVEQIWEKLEAGGLKVGAISPINAVNRTRDSAFFIPDPWTQTSVSGGWALKQVHEALAQAVGDNAQQKITLQTYLKLLVGLAANFRASTILELASYALQRGLPWNNTLFLDRLLADVFIRCWRSARPDFSSLFLNGAAHIQHHYMFSSQAYEGPNRNPEWYIKPGEDPLLAVYALYDRILGEILGLPGEPRVMVATGLHQDPHAEETYYYRLRNHDAFLRKLAVPFQSVAARMSRDFTVYCASRVDAERCAVTLKQLRAPDGEALFSVDNRGADLFVMLTYPRAIERGFIFAQGERPMWDLYDDVAFVAIKNGEHNGIGYFLDTGASSSATEARFPLADLYRRICETVGHSPAAANSGRIRAA